MAMGMSYQDYWYGEPKMAKAYREALKIKQEQTNTDAWIYGLYTYAGLMSALATFLGNKREDYPEKPFELYKKEETPEEIRERYYQRFKRMEELYREQNE